MSKEPSIYKLLLEMYFCFGQRDGGDKIYLRIDVLDRYIIFIVYTELHLFV